MGGPSNQRLSLSTSGASGSGPGSAVLDTNPDPASVASIGLSSRRLPPVPPQRLNYSFAVPDARSQPGPGPENRSTREQYPGLEQNSSKWAADSSAHGSEWVGHSQSQSDYLQSQGANHVSQEPSRMPNGAHRENSRDRYVSQDDSQPSTPASLASMPPPHPHVSPTTLNADGNGLHLPPPGQFAGPPPQGAISGRAVNATNSGPAGRDYTGYLLSGDEQARRSGVAVPKTEDFSGDHLARSEFSPAQQGVRPMHAPAVNGGLQSPVGPVVTSNLDMSVRHRQHPHYNQHGSPIASFTRGIPAQASALGHLQASAPHSPYTPTSADSGSFRQSIPPAVANPNGSDASRSYEDYSRWTNHHSYGR